MGLFHSKDKKTKHLKKYLLNNQYDELNDEELLWAYYLLKPELSFNSLSISNNIFDDAITPYKLHEIYKGVLKEINIRKISY